MSNLLDPIVVTPVQSWLEPDREHSLRLQRFLRAARGPFLLLLLAPALLPAVFTEVPRAAPTGMLSLEGLLHLAEPPTYDVSRLLGVYLLGLAAWLLGIQVGVLIVKIFVRSSTLLYGRAGEVFGASPAGDGESPASPNRHGPNTQTDTGSLPGSPQGEPSGGPSSPTDRPGRVQLRVAPSIFALLFLATYVALGWVRHLRETDVLPRYPAFGLPLFDIPPAFPICVVLAVLAMGYATVTYLPRSRQIPVVLLLVAWFGYANNSQFKNQFENMSCSKSDLVPLRSRVADVYNHRNKHQPHPVHLVSDYAALEAWKAGSADGGPDLDGKGRPKLVLVAVSGGATRSAYWTAVVLDRIEQTLGRSFGRRVRIISGASGGMLGAACYVTYRRRVAEGHSEFRQGAREPGPGLEPASLLPTWNRRDLLMRSLEPLARGIALAEIWNAAWPGTIRRDRGVMLEQDWEVLRYPLVDLKELEEERKVPSMIFSPMIVEDGRRLLISNLELALDGEGMPTSPIVQAASPQINQDEFEQPASYDGTVHRRYSLSSLEYFRMFPETVHRNLYLSTAVRMSASFPFVSPAVNLPIVPPRRVVDAGDYDNYGIQVATSWIRRNQQWLARNTSGVLLVQIRDSSSVRDRLDVDDTEPGTLKAGSRRFQFITSPIDALAKSRYATASFRNDADVVTLNSYNWDFGPDKSDKPFEPASFFTTVIFENSAEVSLDPEDFWSEMTKLEQGRAARRDFREVSMSWNLARAEMAATVAAIPGEPPPPRPDEPDWRKGEERRRVLDKLNGQVSGSPPGPNRAIRLKRMDQLYNYERLINLKHWWNRKGR
jgi:hypothetical protein